MQPGTMRLVNDFVANGFGVVTLREGDYSTLNGPSQPSMGAPIACVGAGTGLGEAYATSSGGMRRGPRKAATSRSRRATRRRPSC